MLIDWIWEQTGDGKVAFCNGMINIFFTRGWIGQGSIFKRLTSWESINIYWVIYDTNVYSKRNQGSRGWHLWIVFWSSGENFASPSAVSVWMANGRGKDGGGVQKICAWRCIFCNDFIIALHCFDTFIRQDEPLKDFIIALHCFDTFIRQDEPLRVIVLMKVCKRIQVRPHTRDQERSTIISSDIDAIGENRSES